MFKKGDVVWSVFSWDDKATVMVKKLTIQSFGKVQGTAFSLKDGKMTKNQIYANQAGHLHHVADVKNIEEFALEIAKKHQAKKIEHYKECVHWAYARNESADNYYFAMKKNCQEVMDAEPKVIFNV